MAVRYLSFTRRYPIDLCRFTPSASTRSFIGLYSTATKHSDGADCRGDDGDDGRSARHIRMLEMKTRKLEEQVHNLNERFKLALADSETIRNRTQTFVEAAKLFGIQCFCRDLVEVADLVEQGLTLEEKDGAQCLASIQRRLQEAFTKHGLEKMKPIGGQYDPYQHQIVCRTPAKGAELGTIAVVKKDGYMLHGRTVRHALVGIAVKTPEQ